MSTFFAQPRIRSGKNPPTDVAICKTRDAADLVVAQIRDGGHKARISDRWVAVNGAKVPIFVVSIWAA